ncbi:murein hydrolase activator NlpD [Musicola keenii]|uniref:murein hydrolase activator NlpD n=1 Tax=Musicola keenii TaxID=2884250 RepID=UPI001780A844|nr:murein hydrolase activator NlpD [Musicola keenii]
MGSQIVSWRQIALCAAVVLGVTGCSNDSSQSAPISNIGDNSAASRSNNTGYTPPPRISSINSAPAAQPPIKPMSAASHGVLSSQPSDEAGITTHDGKIVYNRSYNSIPKGSYTGNTYTVKRGDTLFYIAWITGTDYRDLAQSNNIAEPYSLNVGQSLSLGNNMNSGGSHAIAGSTAVVSTVPVAVADSSSGHMLPANARSSASTSGHMLPSNAANNGSAQSLAGTQIQTTPVDSQPTNAYSENSGKQNSGKMLPSTGVAATAPVTEPTQVPSNSNTVIAGWRWPTDGKVIDSFSATEGGNKGIDIAGSRGQPIISTAAGRVVYAGNALRGYGNLIIIKHNDDYLSAYAHNETMLVREQQEVKAGQQIATMGSTGTSSVRLHFEIRYKGKSVNPLRFLPQR